MPYDDSDVKKMIKYQTERKVGFSRSKRICNEVKDLIHCILEAQVERRYTVLQITQHPWMLQAAVVVPPAAGVPAAARSQTPAPVAVPSGGARVAIIADETGATGARVTAPGTPAAVGNDTSQNNNSNGDRVLSRLLSNFLNSVHSFFSSSSTAVKTTNGELQLAARYALESAIDREVLRRKANRIWFKRRSSLHMALRRPWR